MPPQLTLAAAAVADLAVLTHPLENDDARFAAMLDFVFRWECVYDPCTGLVVAERDPCDPGGVTKYGIDARSHPGVNVAALTRQQATRIYYENYYLASHAAVLPNGLADAHFDAAINLGLYRATRLLQEALGVKMDGIFGPVTLTAAIRCQPAPTVRRMLDLRAGFYRSLARRAESYRVYLAGWLNRVSALRRFIAERTGLDLQN